MGKVKIKNKERIDHLEEVLARHTEAIIYLNTSHAGISKSQQQETVREILLGVSNPDA